MIFNISELDDTLSRGITELLGEAASLSEGRAIVPVTGLYILKALK